MNFISNVLDAIPVVGHTKGLIHYAVGDEEGGHKAMYQSTRTSAVLAGGFVGGALGGPAGAVAGSIYSGSLTDTVASGAMSKSQGILKHCENVSNDFKHGRNPAISLLGTAAHIGLDAIGSLGMDGISSATANSVGKKVVSNVGEEIIEKSVQITAEEVVKLTARKSSETVVKKVIEKTAEDTAVQVFSVAAHIAERALLEIVVEEQAKKLAEQEHDETKETKKENIDKNTDTIIKNKKETSKKTPQSERTTETGTGSQPPEEKKGDNKNNDCNNPNIFSDFLKLKEILKPNSREENREKFYKLFKNLSPGQRTAVQVFSVTTHIAERSLLEIMVEEQAKKLAEQKHGETKATKKENIDKNTDKKVKNKRETSKKTSQSERNTETGSGSQPPEEKKGNNKNEDCNNPNIFSDFLKLLKEILKNNCREGNREKFYKVFENLSPGQRKYLVKLIKKLNYFGALEAVLKLVIQIFDRYFPSDFTFANFLSLMEFVKTYIANKIEEKCMISLGTEGTSLTVQFKQFVAYLMTVVTCDFDILRKIFNTFNDIRVSIQSENAKIPVNPNFRDIFSAVYHYFKHKIVPGDGTLSVSQYYDWIRRLLEKVKRLPEWSHLGDPQNPRNEIIYELYVVAFGRRIKIVVKYQIDRIVLASCYIISMAFDDDEDGDIFIDGICRRFGKK